MPIDVTRTQDIFSRNRPPFEVDHTGSPVRYIHRKKFLQLCLIEEVRRTRRFLFRNQRRKTNWACTSSVLQQRTLLEPIRSIEIRSESLENLSYREKTTNSFLVARCLFFSYLNPRDKSYQNVSQKEKINSIGKNNFVTSWTPESISRNWVL